MQNGLSGFATWDLEKRGGESYDCGERRFKGDRDASEGQEWAFRAAKTVRNRTVDGD